LQPRDRRTGKQSWRPHDDSICYSESMPSARLSATLISAAARRAYTGSRVIGTGRLRLNAKQIRITTLAVLLVCNTAGTWEGRAVVADARVLTAHLCGAPGSGLSSRRRNDRHD